MSKRCRLNWGIQSWARKQSLQQLYTFLCTHPMYACLAVNLARQLILPHKSGLLPPPHLNFKLKCLFLYKFFLCNS